MFIDKLYFFKIKLEFLDDCRGFALNNGWYQKRKNGCFVIAVINFYVVELKFARRFDLLNSNMSRNSMNY